MAALRFETIKPRETISHKAVPAALRQVLPPIFVGTGTGLWLVGGTALAGYYAEHRRSDDLDLFAANQTAFQTAVRNARMLAERGAKLSDESLSPYYFHALARFSGHDFTIDVVLDANLHRVGRAVATDDGIRVPDLPTLAAMKTAALVSRCSEKDLFDMDWILEKAKSWSVKDGIAAAREIDGGVTAESLLLSLQATTLREEACGFILPGGKLTAGRAYRKITALKKRLIRKLLAHEKNEPPSEMAAALKDNIKDFKRR